MPIISSLRRYIYQEDVKYKAGVSEAVGSKLGASINFINERQYSTKVFDINSYYQVYSGQNGINGFTFFTFAAEIFGVYCWNEVAGTSGITEMDLKYSPTLNGSFTSIFTTTPKIDSTAAANARFKPGTVLTGVTAPVLTSSPFQVAADGVLRLDLIQSMADAQNCGIEIHFRPV